MKTIKLGFWVLFTVVFLIVAVALIGQNDDPISVTLFSYSSSSHPKWLVLMVCALIGALLASLFFIVELIVLETKNVRLRRANHKLERALVSSATPNTASGSKDPLIESSSAASSAKFIDEEV
jgi:uncharacterized integral membrane protein